MEILTERTVEVFGYSNPACQYILIALVVFVLSGLMAIILDDSAPILSHICLILTLVSAVVGTIILICGYTPKAEYTEYKVTFNEKIDLNELYKDYEIISQDGELFTIKDKENTPIIKE